MNKHNKGKILLASTLIGAPIILSALPTGLSALANKKVTLPLSKMTPDPTDSLILFSDVEYPKPVLSGNLVISLDDGQGSTTNVDVQIKKLVSQGVD